ncbi:cation channel family protein (macronuclear) [Tetrahymena thermophila SB210]|uniref:Cation channel family protein n=1 Tax=Tetrahymena thermophila (strain SB210) TaxID=312017 RepID=I7M2Z8_TETTS|nr:cation channel family protein [Tetrahymena thermophila SB210]EAS01781.3 cation channel family protein [Tetrahymena thermophila SB210]|eukprot:XP_001022026.3 cation channel family protein [Tetrahymena thermophila SB210]
MFVVYLFNQINQNFNFQQKQTNCSLSMSKNESSNFHQENTNNNCNTNDVNHLRYIMGRQILKKYSAKFLSVLRSKMLQKMSKQQFEILNDKSHRLEDFESKQSTPFLNKWSQNKQYTNLNSLICLSLQIPLFSTESNTIFILNGIETALFYVLGFYFSTLSCFQTQGQAPQFIDKMNLVFIIIQLIQLAIQFNSGIYREGKYISDRFQILKNCLTSYIFYSRISIIAIFLHIEISYQQNFIYLFIIIAHSYSIFCFLSKLQEKVVQFQILKKITSLILLINYAFCIAHVASLMWVYIGIAESQAQQKSWIAQFLKIDENNIEQNKFEIYIASLHYIIVTMVTVGYGDIYPTTSNERLLNILVMITSSFVFAYIVNSVGQILSEIHNSKKEIENKKSIIKAYMKKKNVSIELQQKILQYLYYFWIKSKNSKCNEEQLIINELSDELKQTLLMEANKLIVQDYILFSQNFSEQFLQKVVQIIQEKNFCPFQQIFSVGEKNTSIYFVEEGSAEKYIDLYEPVSLNKKGIHIIQTLEKGMFFGVQEFFTGKQRLFNVRSKDFCTLLCIDREDFMHLLKDFSKDFERFCDIRDTLIFNPEKSDVKLECYGCQQLNHLIENCPYVHYIPDQQKVILKNGYNYVENKRSIFRRKKLKMTKNNTFHNILQIQIDQNKFQISRNDIIEQYMADNIQFDDDSEQGSDNNSNKEDDQAENFATSIREIQKLEDRNTIFLNSPCQRDEVFAANMNQSLDKYDSYERLKSGQSQIKDIPQNFSQSLVKRQISQLFYENQDDHREKNRKSTFVNSQSNQINLAPLTPGINRSKSRSNQNIEPEMFNEGQSLHQVSSPHKISLPSITELNSSQNINQIEQVQKERNNTYISKNQPPAQYQSTANGSGNSLSFNKKINENLKRNSIDTMKTSFINQNKQFFLRNQKNRNMSKILFQQVEQHIQKLQEQFIQTQLQNKTIYQQENYLIYFDLVKSFTNYKPQYNVAEVLKNYRILQLKSLNLDIFKFQPSLQPDEQKNISRSFSNLKKRRQSKGLAQNQGKQLLKKYNIQQDEIDASQQSYLKDSIQKKPGFSDFIFKIQSASFLDTLTNKNNKYQSPLIIGRPEQNQNSGLENKFYNNEKEEFIVDTPKSSVHSLKYLPQYKNFEISKKSQFHDNSNTNQNSDIYGYRDRSDSEIIKEIDISSIHY